MRRIALVAVLLLAGALRFTGLSWGLRHTPDYDERVFVENAVRMVVDLSPDYRFYEYPGLFFYLLCPVLAPFPREVLASAQAYVIARGLVAAFSTASVGLVYLLGSRLLGPAAGLVAALLLAVSPIEVTTAHMVRPDAVLEAFVLLALLAFRQVGSRVRADGVAGAALGAAAAVKFTGVLLLPSYLLARWLRSGSRLRGTLLAGLVASSVWAVATPFAFLSFDAFRQGVHTQWAYHYRSAEAAAHFHEISFYYLRTLARSLGPIGSALAIAGVAAARREWREWSPIVAYPLVMLLVLSTADERWIRLIVPALGAAALVAGRGFQALAGRHLRLAWAATLLGSLVPLADSIAYVRDVSRPGARDQVLDWIATRLPDGSRILSTLPELGLDRRRFEAVFASGVAADDRLLALESDLVLWSAGANDAVRGLRPVYVADPAARKVEGPRIVVYEVPAELRRRYEPVSLASARLSASSDPGQAAAAADGSLDTAWRTMERDGSRQWFEVDLPASIMLGRIELLLGDRPNRAARRLRLLVKEDGGTWRSLHAIEGRCPVAEQPQAGEGKASQVLLTQPVRVLGLRVEGWGVPRQRWGFAEIRLDAIEQGGAASRPPEPPSRSPK